MHKGMSQTLALIVAASVLMMTALTVIFMVQGGLGDVNEGTSTSSCRATIQAKCSTAQSVAPPPSCYGSNGNPIVTGVPQSQSGQVSCEEFLGQ
ncbi:hypothetical protein GLU60_01070 [Nanohaloarchaea archaeon H01]|nr:hypothetical protein [Nanohaloarchaea archaeon H01]